MFTDTTGGFRRAPGAEMTSLWRIRDVFVGVIGQLSPGPTRSELGTEGPERARRGDWLGQVDSGGRILQMLYCFLFGVRL